LHYSLKTEPIGVSPKAKFILSAITLVRTSQGKAGSARHGWHTWTGQVPTLSIYYLFLADPRPTAG